MGQPWRRLHDELRRIDWPWLEFVTAHSKTPIAGASLFTSSKLGGGNRFQDYGLLLRYFSGKRLTAISAMPLTIPARTS